MATYEITSPDGQAFEITAPDDATEEQVMQYAQSQFQPKTAVSNDPTTDMSAIGKFAAGYGSVVPNLWRGTKQLITEAEENMLPSPVLSGLRKVRGVIGIEDRGSRELRKESDEIKRLEAPLMNTGFGKAGNIAGNITTALPAAFVPGANTLMGSALIGGSLGGLQPVGENENRSQNALYGTTAGATGFGLGKGLGKIVKSAGNKVTSIKDSVTAKAVADAASETASARSAAGSAAQDAYRQLEHLRDLGAKGLLTQEQAQVAAQLEKELAEKAAEKLLPAATRKETTAKAFKEAVETESQRAADLAAKRLSGSEVKSQFKARLKRYGPAALGGMVGNFLFPGLGGAVGGAATGLVLRPAIRSMINFSKNPAVQYRMLSPIANAGLLANPRIAQGLGLLSSSIYAGQK